MTDKLMTYNEVLEEISAHDNKTNKNNLLLGNGFSMAYNKDRFSFTSLLNSAIEKILSKEIQM